MTTVDEFLRVQGADSGDHKRPRFFFPTKGGGKYHEAKPVTGVAHCRAIELDTGASPIHVLPNQTKVHPIVCRRCLNRRADESPFKKDASATYPAPHVEGGLLHHRDGKEWFHGTQNRIQDFKAEHEGRDHDDEDDERHYGSGGEHWNTHLGHHFTMHRGVAESFARGKHSYSTGKGGAIHTVHLGITNPKHYAHESEMDHEALDHAWDHLDHEPDSEWDGDHASRYHGGDNDEADACFERGEHEHQGHKEAVKSEPGLAARMISKDSDAHDHAWRFQEHLKKQGHDGVTYGNEVEGPHGHTCAIAFEGSQVHPVRHEEIDNRSPAQKYRQETTAHVLDAWSPTERVFAPTKESLDPRLFRGDEMLPEVRDVLMAKMDDFMDLLGLHSWPDWARMYLAGSEASLWWGNNDFDILVGVEYDTFRHVNSSILRDEEITDLLNAGFRHHWNGPLWFVVRSGLWVQESGFNLKSYKNSLVVTLPERQPQTLPMTTALESPLSAVTSNWQAYPEKRVVVDEPWSSDEPRPVGNVDTSARSARASVESAGLPTTGSTTSNEPWVSRSSSTTTPSSVRAEGVRSVFVPESISPSTMTTPAAPDARRAVSVSGDFSASDATEPSVSWVTATSPEPLFTSEPPPTPEGYVAIGPFDGTGYVNPDSYDIRKIKPYAAYEVVSQRWFVEPISEPEGHHFTESEFYLFEGVAAQIRSILALTEPQRSIRAKHYYNELHHDRSRAFGPNGSGIFDRGNSLEKYLSQCPAGDGHSLWDHLQALRYGNALVALPHEALRAVPGDEGARLVRGHEASVQGLPQQEAGEASAGSQGQRQAPSLRPLHRGEAEPRVREQVVVSSMQQRVLPREGAGSNGRGAAASERLHEGQLPQEDVRDHGRAVRSNAGRAGGPVRDLRGDEGGLGSGQSLCGSQPHHGGAEGAAVRPVQPLGEGPGGRSGVRPTGDGVCREACCAGVDQAGLWAPLQALRYAVKPKKATKEAAVKLQCGDCGEDYFTDGEPHGCQKTATKRKAPGPNGETPNGIMIAIVPPRRIIENIVLSEGKGEDPENLHITLAYLGKISDHSKEQMEMLPELIEAWAEGQKKLDARVQGCGTFVNPDNPNEDERHVLWAAADIPGVNHMYVSLISYLTGHGFDPKQNHGFTPHITLAYGRHHFRFLPKIVPDTFKVREIWCCIGDTWESFGLRGR